MARGTLRNGHKNVTSRNAAFWFGGRSLTDRKENCILASHGLQQIYRKPCLIGMEANGIAHHWARKFQEFGFTVHLIAPQFTRPNLYKPALNAVYATLLAHYCVVAEPARVCDPNWKAALENGSRWLPWARATAEAVASFRRYSLLLQESQEIGI